MYMSHDRDAYIAFIVAAMSGITDMTVSTEEDLLKSSIIHPTRFFLSLHDQMDGEYFF